MRQYLHSTQLIGHDATTHRIAIICWGFPNSNSSSSFQSESDAIDAWCRIYWCKRADHNKRKNATEPNRTRYRNIKTNAGWGSNNRYSEHVPGRFTFVGPFVACRVYRSARKWYRTTDIPSNSMRESDPYSISLYKIESIVDLFLENIDSRFHAFWRLTQTGREQRRWLFYNDVAWCVVTGYPTQQNSHDFCPSNIVSPCTNKEGTQTNLKSNTHKKTCVVSLTLTRHVPSQDGRVLLLGSR